MQVNLASTQGVVFAEKLRMLVAAKIGREAMQSLLAGATQEAMASGRTLREVLRQRPEIASLLTVEQIETLDHPEGYLGATDAFRRRLLEDQDTECH
jgi:3-carboxy-cis,cis-muconate cycloisomerase